MIKRIALGAVELRGCRSVHNGLSVANDQLRCYAVIPPDTGNPFATALAACNVSGATTSPRITPRIKAGPSSAKPRTDGALFHYKRVGHRSPPAQYNDRQERLRAADRWIASFARMQSIRQSVQNGQFLCRLAQNASTQSRRWVFGRIFGLDGRESYRELRREPLCWPSPSKPRNCSA